MVITSQRKTGGIKVPAITIAARNPETEVGWKNGTFGNLYEIDTICNFTTSHDMEACIVKHTYNQKEIIKDVVLGYITQKSLLNPTFALTLSENLPSTSWIGRTYTLNIPHAIGPDDTTDQIFVELEKYLSYRIYIHDPSFFVTSTNPSLPINRMKIDAKTSPNYYYRLALTEVQELDIPEDPCNTKHDYSFKV